MRVITGSLPNGATGSISGRGNADVSGIRSTGGNQITINADDMLKKLNALHESAEANDADLTVTLLADLVPTFHHQVLTEKAANEDKKPEEAVSVPVQG